VAFHTLTRFRQVCGACAEKARERQALFLRSLGSPGVQAAAVPRGALERGIEIDGPEVVFSGADEADPIRVERTSSGRLTLRQLASCAARVVRVEDTVVIGKSADVIAVPYRDDQTWHELRDAACVGAGDPAHEVFGTSQPLPADDAVKNPARFWIEQHRAELARLERGELKQALP
jgi:hypothetical protein